MLERMAEYVETLMMLKVTTNVVSHGKFYETRTAYSCSSETSPVRAENPRNGTSGNETFLNVKHGVQSSPSSNKYQKPFLASSKRVDLQAL